MNDHLCREARDQANLFLSLRSSHLAGLTGQGTKDPVDGLESYTSCVVSGGVDREVRKGEPKRS